MASSSRPAKEAKGSTDGPNWLELPREVTSKILNKLDALDMFTRARLASVSFMVENLCGPSHVAHH